MKPYLIKALFTSLALTSSLLAQDLVKPALTEEGKRVAENLASAAAVTTEDTITSLTPSNNQLEMFRNRAATMRLQQKEYLEKLAAGEITPWEDLRKSYPLMQKQLEELKNSLHSIETEKDPVKRAEIRKVVQTALSFIGPYLKPADPRETDTSLTAEQVTELDQFEAAKRALKPTGNHVLKPLSKRSIHTLLDLEVVFDVQGRPNETLYVEALGGGSFSNGLSVMALNADKEGVASINWISRGYSIGPGVIRVHSSALNILDFSVNVVKLELKNLPDLKQLTDLAPTNLSLPEGNSSGIPLPKVDKAQ